MQENPDTGDPSVKKLTSRAFSSRITQPERLQASELKTLGIHDSNGNTMGTATAGTAGTTVLPTGQPQHGPLLHRRGFPRYERRHLLTQHHQEGPGLTETRDQAIPDKRGHGTPSGPSSPRTQSSVLYNHNVALRGQHPMYPPEYQHLLDFLDSNPEYLHDMRTRLLMPDLIALPEQFAQLVGLVTDLSASFQAFAEATDRRLDTLEGHAAETNRRLASLETNVANVASLNGSDLENRARLNILNIAMNELGLTRGRILLATGRDTEPGFLATINAAEEAGLITEQQADHVLVADIIIRARRTDDKRYVHAVFEVSRTIRLDDITRAHGRAATVASTTGEPTIAAVVGELIQPPQQQQADEMGVKVLLPPLLQQGQASDETAAPIC